MLKKRNPAIAFILSVLAPGVGHIYAGSAIKGLSLIAVGYGVIFLCGITGQFSTFYGIYGIIVFLVGFYLFVIISATYFAYRNKDYNLKNYNRWYVYLLLIIIITIFTNVLFLYRGSILGYETYRIPSNSMAPTLKAGDFITVNTRNKKPKVGDVIIFLSPQDRSTPYAKRVAALGNDTISIVNGEVVRNGNVSHMLSVPESRRRRDFSISMMETSIPENELFLLGDWRDNSKDSRLWGTVPVSYVIGKVTYIWLSEESSRIGLKVK